MLPLILFMFIILLFSVTRALSSAWLNRQQIPNSNRINRKTESERTKWKWNLMRGSWVVLTANKLFVPLHLNFKMDIINWIECFSSSSISLCARDWETQWQTATQRNRWNDVCGAAVCTKHIQMKRTSIKISSDCLLNSMACKAIHIFVQCYSWKVKKLIQTSRFYICNTHPLLWWTLNWNAPMSVDSPYRSVLLCFVRLESIH